MREDDQFQYWLMDMSDAIERFLQSVPVETAESLDFSSNSLRDIEGFALAKYAHIDQLKKPSEAKLVDGMARYVGEVFRKHLGDQWFIDFADKKNAFYGLPQLKGMAGQRTQI